ncbi:3-oxosteroid 1-dehydrogenase [Sphingobium sp. SCG-1]|uniref:FAD-dependent oxidoreductase n=1 Tax=Sphingobium sp. SCG-1 TaxID=2072936 RepID=UPI000CD69495|nr:FAD-dependent oxidoreductase [Sphingobium sp. SCG-1]AUW58765.1 3-oxosteroid 1-dehydrogenase [Sphingobium sp. SCG-1]
MDSQQGIENEYSCDLLVVGSGGGAMTAALTALHLGLDVIVAEKEAVFGGATARSGGWLWVPCSSLAQAAGIQDSPEAALAYLRHEAGPHFDKARAEAYVAKAPEMMDFVLANSPVRFTFFKAMPDYHPTAPGGVESGRVIYTSVWDGRCLGKDLDRLRKPLKSMTAFGVQIGNEDLSTFISAGRKPSSALRVLRLVAGNIVDRLRSGQPTRLTSGRALIGGLAKAVLDRGGRLWTDAPVRRLLIEQGRVVGAIVQHGGRNIEVRACKGVVLGTGGFPHDTRRRNELLGDAMGDVATNSLAWGLMPYGNTGDGLRMAEQISGHFDDKMIEPIAYSPVTQSAHDEGDLSIFPIFIQRAVPGQICVTRSGRRFISEGASYHDWGAALVRATYDEAETAAWFICDKRSLDRYGLCAVPPQPLPHRKFVRSGYLKKADTIRELAEIVGIDPDGLESTVKRFNANVLQGSDPEFGRGESAYDIVNGDPDHKPNPCLGPLDQSPYFAVKGTAGCGGTHAGLATDADARVLRSDGGAIPGLYAVGNDAAAVTGGNIIAGGITIGPAMTFGYLAAHHASRKT